MALDNRYEFAFFFDVTDGNPNGDPDMGNQPRMDHETSIGLVTDGCIKQKIRKTIRILKGDQPPYDIYVKQGGILSDEQKAAYEAIGMPNGSDKAEMIAQQYMVQRYADVRWFGAVMSGGKVNSVSTDKEPAAPAGTKTKAKPSKGKQLYYNCGQVMGPLQISMARSIDPISPVEYTITRVALTNFGDTKAGQAALESGEEVDTSKAMSGQMGSKWAIPYGLYRVNGFLSPYQADQTGFSEEDLNLLWKVLGCMFDYDRSAARPMMAAQELIVFKHAEKLGNYPAHKLMSMIQCNKIIDGVPRKFDDYKIEIVGELPAGVEVLRPLQS